VSRWHDFLPEDLSSGETELRYIEPRPFDRTEGITNYIFSLPETHDASARHPWNDRKWQGEWLWNLGGISAREAHFWIFALTHEGRLTDTRTDFAETTKVFRRQRYTGVVTKEWLRERLVGWFEAYRASRSTEPPHSAFCTYARLVRELLEPAELIDLCFEIIPFEHVRHYLGYVAPSGVDEQDERARARIRHHLGQLEYTDHVRWHTATQLLRRFSMPEEVRRLVCEMRAHSAPPENLMGAIDLIEDPEEYAEAFRTIPAKLYPPDIGHIFGKGSWGATPHLFERVRKGGHGLYPTMIVELMKIHSPEAAEGMLQFYEHTSVSRAAHGWLMEEGANAVEGMLNVASRANHPLRHLAFDILRELRDRGHADLIEHVADAHGRDVKDVVDHVFGRDAAPAAPADELPAEVMALARDEPPKRTPAFLDPEWLPALQTLEGRRSPVQVSFGVLTALTKAKTNQPLSEDIQRARELFSEESRHHFAMALLESWEHNGCPAKPKMCLYALGWLGGDAAANELPGRIEQWHSDRSHARARWGIDVLRIIGTDGALTMLNKLAYKGRSRGVKKAAAECMTRIAQDRNLTPDELEDRIVPDCGLTEGGRRIFDFGPRQVTMWLGDDLKPRVTLPSGKVRSSLPPTKKSDDPDLVAAARADWKVVTKQLREAVKVQVRRMEDAFATERRWEIPDFRLFIQRHPLMTVFARRLVWGLYDQDGALQSTVRLSAEGDFTDAQDDAVELDGRCVMGIAHPIELSDEARDAWLALFADYEIIQPFEQLQRPVFELDEEERLASFSERFYAFRTTQGLIRARLEPRGWIYGDPQDAGEVRSLVRRIPRHGLSAILFLDRGPYIGHFDPDEECEIEALGLYEDLQIKYVYANTPLQPVVLGDVSPVVMSELMYDIAQAAYDVGDD